MAAYEDTDAEGGSWNDRLAPEWGGRRRSLRAQRVARQLVELSRLNDGVEVAELQTIELMTFLPPCCGTIRASRSRARRSRPRC